MAKPTPRQKSVSSGRVTSPSKTHTPQPSGSMALLDLLLLILAGAGIVLTTYLTYTASFEVHPAFCREGSGCDIVQSSRWATFLGMPMGLWSLFTYILIAGLAWVGRGQSKTGTALIFVAMGGFAVSAYLTVVSVVEIEATCPYCLTSFAIMTTILGIGLARRPPNWTKHLQEAAVIGVLIVGVLHLHYSGWFDAAAGPEDPQLQALVTHLDQTGARFYGAYWCPHCQEQKTIFFASAKRLPYVECSSGGRGSALTAPCAKAHIQTYPTWIIGERRITGLQTPQELAHASGFNWQE